MRLPFLIFVILVFLPIVSEGQETFITSFKEGNFTVKPWFIEHTNEGPIVCGFKSKEDPNRAYFYCDQFDKDGFKLRVDSILFNQEFIFFANNDNRPTVFEDELYLYKQGYDGEFYIINVNLINTTIQIVDTINFQETEFQPEHMLYVADGNYRFAGSVKHESSDGPIADFAIAKIDNGELEVYSERKIENTFEFGRRVLSYKNDSLKILSDFSRGLIYRGFQVSTFNEDLVKIDSVRTFFTVPRLGIKFDGLEDSEGNVAFVSWGYDDFENFITLLDSDGENVWHKEIGHNLNAGTFSKVSSLVESNEEDGFVFVGSDYTGNPSVDSLFSYAVIGKISKEGVTQWYRKYKLIDSTRATHEFLDIVSDGQNGYYLTGNKFTYDNNEPEPVQMILARVDSVGLIDGYVGIESIELITKSFSVSPNPAKDYFKILSENEDIFRFEVLNSHGQVMSVIKTGYNLYQLEVDVSDLPSGIYFVKSYSHDTASSVQKIMKL